MLEKRYKADRKKLAGLVKKGRFGEALSRSRQMCEKYPSSPEVRIYAALSALNLSQHAVFQSIFQQLMQLERGDTEDYMLLGQALLEKGNREAGIQCIQRVVSVESNNIPALRLLASGLLSLEQFDGAESFFLRISALEGEKSSAWFFLGAISGVQGKYNKAVEYTERAISADVCNIDAHFNLAGAYKHLDETEKAIGSYLKVVELDADHYEAHGNLGVLYKKLGNTDKARRHFEEAIRIQPDKEAMKYQLASLTGKAIPAESVASLFDQEAEIFEGLLVNELGYVTPQLLRDAVKTALDDEEVFDVALDIGCGTGLCGSLFKELCGRLVGVDLSQEMIKKAEEKKVYDELHVVELVEFLRNSNEEFYLMIAADVFNYVGDLVPVFSACRNRLVPGGVIVFSTEINDSELLYMDDRTLRYSHARKYVEATVSGAGFGIVCVDEKVLRRERGEPVYGNIFVCRSES